RHAPSRPGRAGAGHCRPGELRALRRAAPAGSRRDQVCCNNNCSALASYYRRKRGAAPPPRWQHPAVSADDPALRAAAACGQQLGEAHGWDRSTIRLVLDGLAVVLDGRTAGERVSLTEIRTRTP